MADRFSLMRFAPTWRCSPLAILAIAAISTLVTFNSVEAKKLRAAREKEAIAQRDAGEPIMAIVSIKSQKVTFYDADGWIARAPVSTGVTGRETPAGVFAILQKNEDHHSSLYDDAWMPHMQRITWNGVALHGGPLPGYAASHGCVRMPYGFAGKVFEKTRIGMRVIVSPQDAEPIAFSHPSLFVPNREAIAAIPGKVDKLAQIASEAAKAADDAKAASKMATSEAASSAAALRKIESLKADAEADVARADKAIAKAKSDDAKQRAEEAKQKAGAKAADASAKLDTARSEAKLKSDAALATKDAIKLSDTRKAETAKAASDAKLAGEPVSIFISRATQKIYVRRNTRKPWSDGGEVFDFSIELPVTIRNPEKPIGTHIFTAMARNDSGLRWSAVTIDGGDNAKDALDRITIPQEIIDGLAATALPRSSIVISDEPLSSETNYRTEFVAVLSNQPQGGFITRQPESTDRVARGRSNDDDDYGFVTRRRSVPEPTEIRRRARPSPSAQDGDFFFPRRNSQFANPDRPDWW